MTINTLLIPTDGSDIAQRAAHRGFDLATQLNADIHLLSVADSSLATGVGYSGNSARIRSRLREQATERAESLSGDAIAAELTVTTAIRDGIPAQEIVEYASEYDLDAIVIGTTGRGGVPRAVIGSVADKVIRSAAMPVVTLNRECLHRNNQSRRIESILIPTDGSEQAVTAASRASELASQLGARIHVLSVKASDQVEEMSSWVDDPTRLTNQHASAAVDRIGEDCRDHGLDVVTAIRSGTPAEEICDYVIENEIVGIVMGTQGRSGFQRWVMGSVTDAVVRTAPVPVITIRPAGGLN